MHLKTWLVHSIRLGWYEFICIRSLHLIYLLLSFWKEMSLSTKSSKRSLSFFYNLSNMPSDGLMVIAENIPFNPFHYCYSSKNEVAIIFYFHGPPLLVLLECCCCRFFSPPFPPIPPISLLPVFHFIFLLKAKINTRDNTMRIYVCTYNSKL